MNYTIEIKGQLQATNIAELLSDIADQIQEQMQYKKDRISVENSALTAEAYTPECIQCSELYWDMQKGEVEPDELTGQGQTSCEPETWEIHSEDGGCYYYYSESEYKHDCEKLNIANNL